MDDGQISNSLTIFSLCPNSASPFWYQNLWLDSGSLLSQISTFSLISPALLFTKFYFFKCKQKNGRRFQIPETKFINIRWILVHFQWMKNGKAISKQWCYVAIAFHSSIYQFWVFFYWVKKNTKIVYNIKHLKKVIVKIKRIFGLIFLIVVFLIAYFGIAFFP